MLKDQKPQKKEIYVVYKLETKSNLKLTKTRTKYHQKIKKKKMKNEEYQ